MGQAPSSFITANAMSEQRDKGPLLHRQHAVQQGNLSSAAQRMAQPTASEGYHLQSSLPYGNNQFSRAGFAGEHDGVTTSMAPDESGEKLPLFYWWGLAAWNKTRGTARVDLMRPRWCLNSATAHVCGASYGLSGWSHACCRGPRPITLVLSVCLVDADSQIWRLATASFMQPPSVGGGVQHGTASAFLHCW